MLYPLSFRGLKPHGKQTRPDDPPVGRAGNLEFWCKIEIMNIKIEEIGPCKKLLKIEVPKEKIENEWQKQLNEVCKMQICQVLEKVKRPRSLLKKGLMIELWKR